MSENIHADMSATVWKIVAAEGTEIAADEPIMILESMKMEIPVVSEDGGRIARIAVEEDASVSEGDLLAVIE